MRFLYHTLYIIISFCNFVACEYQQIEIHGKAERYFGDSASLE